MQASLEFEKLVCEYQHAIIRRAPPALPYFQHNFRSAGIKEAFALASTRNKLEALIFLSKGWQSSASNLSLLSKELLEMIMKVFLGIGEDFDSFNDKMPRYLGTGFHPYRQMIHHLQEEMFDCD